MNVCKLGILFVEIYKEINELETEFIRTSFKVKKNNKWEWEKHKLNLETPE